MCAGYQDNTKGEDVDSTHIHEAAEETHSACVCMSADLVLKEERKRLS